MQKTGYSYDILLFGVFWFLNGQLPHLALNVVFMFARDSEPVDSTHIPSFCYSSM